MGHRRLRAGIRPRPEQRVVTSGPYRLVRHPSYLGVLILFVGLASRWAISPARYR
jgi:protein-S-isoprenylcysteine O-methyltransferase Ste14